MKLQGDTREVMKGGVGQVSAFTIKATGKAFQILSSGLYSNKILAVIRELSCNAYDAHVEAGKADVPIEVYLPNTLRPTFTVKDFGTGLSDYQIRGGYALTGSTKVIMSLEDGAKLIDEYEKQAAKNPKTKPPSIERKNGLYNSYFESTKQDSNDFIGALGLGSKSPFSLVSSFSVESRVGGTKRLYTAFVDEQGMPSIALVGESSTTEPNGMTVSMAVKQDDIFRFASEAQQALMYFNPYPIVRGTANFAPLPLEYITQGKNWGIRPSLRTNWDGARVIQGNVAYPLDAKQLTQHTTDKMVNAFLCLAVDINVPIGAVDVAASRESLQYNAYTIDSLLKIINEAVGELGTVIQAEFNKRETLWEATRLFVSYSQSDSYSLRNVFERLCDLPRTKNHPGFTWRGKPIDNDITFRYYNDIKTTTIISASTRTHRGKGRLSVYGRLMPTAITGKVTETVTIQPRKNTLVFVDDKIKDANQRIMQYIMSLCNNHNRDVIIIRAISKSSYNQQEIDKVINLLGDPSVILASSLDKVISTASKQPYAKRDRNTRLQWKGFPTHKGCTRRTFSHLCWTQEQVDIKDGGFYVPIERFTIINAKNKNTSDFGVLIASADTLGLWDASTPIYGFNEKDLLAIKDNKKWKNLFIHLEEQFKSINTDDTLLHRLAAMSAINHTLGLGISKNIIDKWSRIDASLKNCSFKDFFAKLVYWKNGCQRIDSQAAIAFSNAIGMTSFNGLFDRNVQTLNQEWANLQKEYKMFELIQWSWITPEHVAVIIEYVNSSVKS